MGKGKHIWLTDQAEKDLAALMDRWKIRPSAAIQRALREAVEREQRTA